MYKFFCSLIVVVYLLMLASMAFAEGVVAESVCVYKKTPYDCILLDANNEHHIILTKRSPIGDHDNKVIVVYKLSKTPQGIKAEIVFEYGWDI